MARFSNVGCGRYDGFECFPCRNGGPILFLQFLGRAPLESRLQVANLILPYLTFLQRTTVHALPYRASYPVVFPDKDGPVEHMTDYHSDAGQICRQECFRSELSMKLDSHLSDLRQLHRSVHVHRYGESLSKSSTDQDAVGALESARFYRRFSKSESRSNPI